MSICVITTQVRNFEKGDLLDGRGRLICEAPRIEEVVARGELNGVDSILDKLLFVDAPQPEIGGLVLEVVGSILQDGPLPEQGVHP